MGKISLIVIILVVSATFYFTSISFKNTDQSANRTFVDEAGHLHVMGIILGQSTVREAEKAFRSRVDAAIFMYPDPQTTGKNKFKLDLEAYFPSIADHTKVMLKLTVDDAQLEAIRQRSSSPRMYPNGIARRNLANEDILAIQHMIIHQLILMPSTDIDLRILEAQFGKAAKSNIEQDGHTSYQFPSIGLEANINPEGKDKLTFTNPIQATALPATI